MVMKDKLVKYNHKAPYYRMRKCTISFAAFLGLAVSIALPVSINIASKNSQNPIAGGDDTSTSQKENNNENKNDLKNDLLLEY